MSMTESADLLQYSKRSFSQCGEDLILRHIFNSLKVAQPTYVDVGAHHPFRLNNTALFHLAGSRGINIEPNPELFALFQQERPLDTNLNAGISDTEGESTFYMIDPPVFGTFSREVADDFVTKHGFHLKNTVTVPCTTITNVLQKYFNGSCPDFISIDAEGVDEIIIDSIISNNLPFTAICVETISFSNKGMGGKNQELIQKLADSGYINYADTNINTIFVKKDVWQRG